MKTRLALCLGRLSVVTVIGLISMASPVLAQDDFLLANRGGVSPVSVISQETLDGLLAPIALYPDALLAQVLMAVTYPIDVVEAARWQQENPDLSEQALQDALASFDWNQSVKSLVTVPQVLQQMRDSPRWMQDLGRAVMDDQERVMATVQELRKKARVAGTLTSNDKQTVDVAKGAEDGTEYVTITPASPKVVYVPVYDPYIVYGTWWWPTRPIYWRPPSGVWLTSGFYWSNHYYPSAALWGGFDWGLGVMIINAPVYYGYYRIRPSSRSNYVWRSTSHRPLVDGRRYSSPRRSVAPGGAGVRPPRPSASGRPGAHPHRGGGGGGYRGGGRRP